MSHKLLFTIKLFPLADLLHRLGRESCFFYRLFVIVLSSTGCLGYAAFSYMLSDGL